MGVGGADRLRVRVGVWLGGEGVQEVSVRLDERGRVQVAVAGGRAEQVPVGLWVWTAVPVGLGVVVGVVVGWCVRLGLGDREAVAKALRVRLTLSVALPVAEQVLVGAGDRVRVAVSLGERDTCGEAGEAWGGTVIPRTGERCGRGAEWCTSATTPTRALGPLHNAPETVMPPPRPPCLCCRGVRAHTAMAQSTGPRARERNVISLLRMDMRPILWGTPNVHRSAHALQRHSPKRSIRTDSLYHTAPAPHTTPHRSHNKVAKQMGRAAPSV